MDDWSNSWWQKRALEDEKWAYRNAANASADLQKLYQRQYEQIIKRTTMLMAQIQSGETPSRTSLWEYTQWRELERGLTSFVRVGSLAEQEKIRECIDDVFQHVIGVPIDSVSRQRFSVGLDAKSIVDVAWSGERYSDRVWHNRAALAEKVKNSLADMIVQGKTMRAIREELMLEFGVGYRVADRLVRTEASYAFNRAAVERYKNMGVAHVRWSTGEFDGDECKICSQNSGSTWSIDDTPVLPAHPNCRCVWSPVVEVSGKTAAQETINPANMSVDELQRYVRDGIIPVNYAETIAEANREGGRHSGKWNDAMRLRDSELRSAIESTEITVMKHFEKINSPWLHDKKWNEKNTIQKTGLIRKWMKDIIKNAELMAIFKELLRMRE